jgi:hypothetical protein
MVPMLVRSVPLLEVFHSMILPGECSVDDIDGQIDDDGVIRDDVDDDVSRRDQIEDAHSKS